MISSKKITLIALLLIAAAVCFSVWAMMFAGNISDNLTGSVEYSEQHIAVYSEDDYYSNYSHGSVAKINLSGTSAESNSKNVTVDGGKITIMGGGTYVLSGELSDGSIIVDSSDGAVVRLILNGASVTSADFSALYVKQAEKVVISMVEGTQNSFTDAKTYNQEKLEDGAPSAAIYSKDDLTVNGSGTLIVNGNYQDAIKANDILKVTGGTLKITAFDEGINVNDYAVFQKAELEITSGGDAVKCENEESEKGFIAFEGTTVNAVSEGDGIYSSSAIYANDVTAQITAGGGSANAQIESSGMGRPFGFENGNQASEDTPSTKAIKAYSIFINGGEYTLDSSDDAIHSDGNLNISRGKFEIATGDDAIHAEMNATLEPETLKIIKCREGIEGAYIVINGGNISIVSNDDAINAVGENSAGGFGMPMGTVKENILPEDIYLTINGGNLYIETGGDGVDSNGAAQVNGGRIEVYGPENNGNSSLDFEYGFIINKGTVLAAGSSGMAELPSDLSQQQSVVFYLDENFAQGSTITLTDSNGNEIISGTSNKRFNWVCVSSADLKAGSEYTLSVNGSRIDTVEVTSTVTSSGNRRGGR